MKNIIILSVLAAVILSEQSYAAGYRSPEYCEQLANIGKNVYKAKQDGHSLSAITSAVSDGLTDDKDRQTVAVGVATSIYGDSSISSDSEAYNIVFDSCNR